MKAFIFDLDGVIVDTAKYHYLAWRKMANLLGFDISLTQNEALKGVSREASLQKILTWGNKELSKEDFEKCLKQKNEDYLAYISKMTASDILVDVKKTLVFLKDQGQQIALGSASKNARLILEKMELMPFFKVIVDGNDVTKGKPDPEVFLTAASKLGVAPENCIVFEDAVAGIEAANKGGMLSIGIGDKEGLKEAAYVFTDFTEISTAFLSEIIQN